MEHWAGRWNKQKTPPVLPTPRACRSDCPEGNTDRTTVFYHLRAGLSKCTHGGVFYGKTNQHSSLAAESAALADQRPKEWRAQILYQLKALPHRPA